MNRIAIFGDDEDYERYIRTLGHITADFDWLTLCFCLMPNHVHLLIETREPNLGKGMQRLHSRFARNFNDRHGRVGHLFQGRFQCTPITDDLHFLTAACYVALNPVRANLCHRPNEWPWSSEGLRNAGTSPTWLADAVLRARLLEITGKDDTFELISP